MYDEFADIIDGTEQVNASWSIDGIHSSTRLPLEATTVVLTNRHLIACRKVGIFNKRNRIQASWAWDSFQLRTNANEGTALGGKFLYCLALFSKDGETLLLGFKRTGDRDAFKETVGEAIGWNAS